MDCSTAVLCVVLLPSCHLHAPLVGAWQKQEQWFPGKLGRDWWEREREGENGGRMGIAGVKIGLPYFLNYYTAL